MDYASEVKRMEEVAEKYSSLCFGLKEQYDKEVVSVQFASGDSVLHRGYYCPSLVRDIVVGNCKRGKLLKRASSKETYKYGFDSNGKMITVEHSSPLMYDEIIIHQDQVEIGIAFKELHGIIMVSECVYNHGQIMSYTNALYSSFDKFITETKKEIYSYSGEGLEKADFLLIFGSKTLVQHYQYKFQHDSEGYLSSYTIDQIAKDGSVKPRIWKGQVLERPVHDINIKRKV